MQEEFVGLERDVKLLEKEFCLSVTPLDPPNRTLYSCGVELNTCLTPLDSSHYKYHRKEIRKLTFRALALRRSESRNCGLCVVYIQKDGATLLVGAW